MIGMLTMSPKVRSLSLWHGVVCRNTSFHLELQIALLLPFSSLESIAQIYCVDFPRKLGGV